MIMVHTLESDGIYFKRGGRVILAGVHIRCETGKITGLLGRNGHGKSTLIEIIYGSLTAGSQSVRLDGRPAGQLFLQKGAVSYLTQFHFIPASFSPERIFRDFELDYDPFVSQFPEFRTKYKQPLCGFSGGQRRLIEIYTCLKANVKFVLMDEPFSHLSPLMAEQVQELIREEKKHKGILLTDHLHRNVTGMADEIYLLSEGYTSVISSREELVTAGYLPLQD